MYLKLTLHTYFEKMFVHRQKK